MVLWSDVPKGGRDTDLYASGILPQRSSVLFSRVGLNCNMLFESLQVGSQVD